MAGSELEGVPGVDLKAGRRRVIDQLAGIDPVLAARQAGHASTSTAKAYSSARPVSLNAGQLVDPDAATKSELLNALLALLRDAGFQLWDSGDGIWEPTVIVQLNDLRLEPGKEHRKLAKSIAARAASGAWQPRVILASDYVL